MGFLCHFCDKPLPETPTGKTWVAEVKPARSLDAEEVYVCMACLRRHKLTPARITTLPSRPKEG
jgi:hypothetical protein